MLVLFPLVVALGCGSRAATKPGTCSAAACARPHVRVAAVRTAQRLQRQETKQTQAPPPSPTGVPLTDPELPYAQRVDPSGWSGHSVPPAAEEEPWPAAVGGGPAADDENPYPDDPGPDAGSGSD